MLNVHLSLGKDLSLNGTQWHTWQSFCHLHKTIITKQSFASAHVPKTHFSDITVQVSCVLLRADSLEKDASVTCKSQL